MCLSVLNWINDLFVSVFLEVIAKKKKKKVLYLWILAKSLIVCFCFLNPILESEEQNKDGKLSTAPGVHDLSLSFPFPLWDFALLRTQTYLLTNPRMLSPANSP